MNEPLWKDDAGPIKEVWEDMPVVDAAGTEVGRVEFVKMGDEAAATTRGQVAPEGGGILGGLARLFGGGEPDTPRQAAEHLVRVGFVKVDGDGLADRDLYVAADQIAGVADGRVQLSVSCDDLVAER